MKILKKFCHNRGGFSLVEAIVSVVIVGLAILPISMVYTNTISRTVDTRKQLEANKVAEQYMEAIKDKKFSDFNDVFHSSDGLNIYDDGIVTFDRDTDLSLMLLNDPPEGYSIRIGYDNVPLYDATVAMPTAAAAAVVDGIIEINSGSSQEVIYIEGDGSLYVDPAATTPTGTVRDIEVIATRSDDKIVVVHKDGSGTIRQRFEISNPTEYALRFVLGDNGSEIITTTVDIQSDMSKQLKLYFYEQEDNTIDAKVDVSTGFVSISRNLYLVNFDEPRITKLDVEVIEKGSGQVLASLSSSKINE